MMPEQKEKLPRWHEHFLEQYPDIATAYNDMGDAVNDWGPLGEKAGANREEIEHVAVLTPPTVGFPTMMALLSIFDEAR
jgi:alkylhydroperoxidase/carboxymuconolactone decarboxylase family protein YurZ